jgi:hypothetical protein
MSLDRIPDELRQAIERDHRAVRPLQPIWLRVMLAVSALAVVLALVLAKASLRADLDELPMWLSWGCSALQLLLGVMLLGLAVRESVPGAAAPLGAVSIAALLAVGVQLLVGVATAVLSPTIALSGDGLGPGVGCLKHESLLALPAFAVTLWLVFRALPLRAPVAGLLGGAGAAVAADAAIHLMCPVSNLSHVIVWHTGAVVLFMVVGWAAGAAWERLRWSQRS